MIISRALLAACVVVIAGVYVVGVPARIDSPSVSAKVATQGSATLAESVAPMAAHNLGKGAASGGQSDTIEVWLAGREQAAQRFVDAVSTPGSPSYLRFLTPSGFTKRFGPSAAQVLAVESYLSRAGFARVHASVDDDYVLATASVSTIDRAFSTQMRRYQVMATTGKTTFETNDRALTVPATISSDILAVTGLDTASPQVNDLTSRAAASPTTVICSRYWAEKTTTVSPPFDGITEAAVPVCGYSAKQLRAAYGLAPSDAGAGTTIALIEIGAPTDMFQTLTDYAKANGLPAPRRSQYRQEAVGRGGGKCVNTELDEELLDSEAAYAMAPGAELLMVDGNSCQANKDYVQALFDAMLAPLTGKTGPSAAIESVSYGLGYPGESSVPKSQLKVSHAIALRAAAEGVSLLISSGDSPGVESPSSDPDVTAVGGTTLGIGAHDQRLFEASAFAASGQRTGQSGPWFGGALLGTGGGVSSVYGEPSYQKGVVPGAMSLGKEGHAGRVVPDLSADAGASSPMLVGKIPITSSGKTTTYETFPDSGTSVSTPLVAGMVADAEQGGRSKLGFLNPLLYSLAGTRVFHDIAPLGPSAPQDDRAVSTTGGTYIHHKYGPGFLVEVNASKDAQSGQITASGYDTMTGLGSPNGPEFITALRSATKSASGGGLLLWAIAAAAALVTAMSALALVTYQRHRRMTER